jgi:hypothetical protein
MLVNSVDSSQRPGSISRVVGAVGEDDADGGEDLSGTHAHYTPCKYIKWSMRLHKQQRKSICSIASTVSQFVVKSCARQGS